MIGDRFLPATLLAHEHALVVVVDCLVSAFFRELDLFLVILFLRCFLLRFGLSSVFCLLFLLLRLLLFDIAVIRSALPARDRQRLIRIGITCVIARLIRCAAEVFALPAV